MADSDYIYQDKRRVSTLNQDQGIKHIYHNNEELKTQMKTAKSFAEKSIGTAVEYVKPVHNFLTMLEEQVFEMQEHDRQFLLSLFMKIMSMFCYNPIATIAAEIQIKLDTPRLTFAPQSTRQDSQIKEKRGQSEFQQSSQEMINAVKMQSGLSKGFTQKQQQSPDRRTQNEDNERESGPLHINQRDESKSCENRTEQGPFLLVEQGCEDERFAKHSAICKEPKEENDKYTTENGENKERKSKQLKQKTVTRFGIPVVLPEGLSVTSTLKPKEKKKLRRIYNQFLEKVQDNLPEYIIDTYMSKTEMKIHIGFKPGTEKQSREFIQGACDENIDWFEFEPREPPQFLSSKLKHCFQSRNPFDCDMSGREIIET